MLWEAGFHGEAEGHFAEVADGYGVDGADVVEDFVAFLEDDDAAGFGEFLHIRRDALEVGGSSGC
ncbi:hypothetical protein D3C86_1692230 [compost metagenome]